MKRKINLICLYLFICLFSVFGCFKQPYSASFKETRSSKITDPLPATREVPSQFRLKQMIRLRTDLKRLHSFSAALAEMANEMDQLRKRSKIWKKDYFPPEEHDKIENMVFRYRLIRQSLWEMIDYYIDYRDHFSDSELQTKGFLIGFSAGLHLTTYSSLVVATFLKEPMGKSKINEAYHPTGIPEGTYDLLYSQVTSIENLETIKTAWFLFSNEWKDPDSILHGISRSDRQYRELIEEIHTLHDQTEKQIQFILKEDALLFPKTTNRLRQTMIIKLANLAKGTLDDNLYAIRGLLFSNISNLKSPLTRPLTFSPEQKNHIKSLLEPGDIILTYTAGYMSNIFLPGKFKHGIIYIGTQGQRNALGITKDNLADIPRVSRKTFLSNLSKETLDSGSPADVIEAVSEGVIFNSLDYLMESHINRMVALRPRLTNKERITALVTVFSLLGSDYDFKFDFNNGTFQCCTEVIYRALNSKGICDFSLVKRMGSFTLSADDIIRHQLALDPAPFDFVLYTEKDPAASGHKALILTAEEGLTKFRRLMASQPPTTQ